MAEFVSFIFNQNLYIVFKYIDKYNIIKQKLLFSVLPHLRAPLYSPACTATVYRGIRLQFTGANCNKRKKRKRRTSGISSCKEVRKNV